jgi:hypothetical protein
VKDEHSAADDSAAPGHDSPVELARPVSEDSKVFEGSRGMHLDPQQVPMTLMQPAKDAGQPLAPTPPTPPTAQTPTPEGQPEAK